MRLIAVGRLRDGPEAELFARYNTRLTPRLSVTEVPEGHGRPDEMARREAASILAALPASPSVTVALDLGGRALDSPALARQLAAWRDGGRQPCFIIGGAEGLDAAVLAQAGLVLSFGTMTWPHMLARVLLTEQLFRAQCIQSGHPYHRAGRPALPAAATRR